MTNANHQLTEIRLDDGTGQPGALYRSYEYDANGQLTARRDGAGILELALHPDARGRVASADVGGVEVARYRYDPLGYRIEVAGGEGVRRRWLDAEHLEAVTDASGARVATYQRGTVIDEVVNAYYYDADGKPTNLTYHHDSLQSVVGLSGHAGTVEQTLQYGPFGELLSSSGASASALRFTGRDYDAETGLYYYRARTYDPELGRFLSEDPLGFGGGDVNLYAYVGSNPLRFNDPAGKCPTCPTAAIGAVVGAVGGGLTAYLRSGGDLRATALGAGVGLVGGAAAGLTLGGATVFGFAVSPTAVSSGAIGAVTVGGGNVVGQAFADGRVDVVEAGLATLAGAIPGAVQGFASTGIAALGSQLVGPQVAKGAVLAAVNSIRLGTVLLADAIAAELPDVTFEMTYPSWDDGHAGLDAYAK